MEAQGFFSLPDFFKHRDEKAKQQESSKAELMVVEAAPDNSKDMPEAPAGSTATTETSEKPSAASAETEKSLLKPTAPRASTAMVEEEEEEEVAAFIPATAVSALATAQEEEEEEEEDMEVTLSKAGGVTLPTCPPSNLCKKESQWKVKESQKKRLSVNGKVNQSQKSIKVSCQSMLTMLT